MEKCSYFDRCGGCNKLSISYQDEIKEKTLKIKGLFSSIGYQNDIPYLEAFNPYYYRNKAQLAFKLSKTKHVVSGIYEEFSHNIIPVKDCLIQAKPINKVLESVNIAMNKNKILPFVNGGFVKHVLVRYGFNSKELMVVVVTESEFFPGRANFVKTLLALEPKITTIIQNIQNRDTVIVLGTKEKVLYGKGYIKDTLCGLTFKLSPRSFYQINPIQTERLYNLAIAFANLNHDDIVVDAYSGIGTIGMTVAKNAKKVICIENNPDACKDARYNVMQNKLNNVVVVEADSTGYLNELAQMKIKVNCLFLDPPRTGTTKEFILSVAKMNIKRVVYISCGPDTLIRDLVIFKEHNYIIKKVSCVDMFPRTTHIETVCLLERKK